jgi:hypothetical protein
MVGIYVYRCKSHVLCALGLEHNFFTKQGSLTIHIAYTQTRDEVSTSFFTSRFKSYTDRT